MAVFTTWHSIFDELTLGCSKKYTQFENAFNVITVYTRVLVDPRTSRIEQNIWRKLTKISKKYFYLY